MRRAPGGDAGTRAAAITTREAALRPRPGHRAELQDAEENTTRFVVISTRPSRVRVAVKCSVLLDPRTDRTGLLADLLGCLRARDQPTRIEPARRNAGSSYVFFLDGEAVRSGARRWRLSPPSPT
jgi:prephenate dehydratase